MTELEMAADYLETVDMLKVLTNALLGHVCFGISYHQIACGAVVLDSSSEVTWQEVLAIVVEDFHLWARQQKLSIRKRATIPVCP